MKHTKGNWEPIFKYYEKDPKKICLGVGINSKVKGGIYTEFICNSMLPDSDREYIKQQDEIEGNMKLVAAAPELLKACQIAMESDIDGSFVSATKWWIIMKKAIKKATL